MLFSKRFIVSMGIAAVTLGTGCKGDGASPVSMCAKSAELSKKAGHAMNAEAIGTCVSTLSKIQKEEPKVFACLGPCVGKATAVANLMACRKTCKMGAKAKKARDKRAKSAIAAKYHTLNSGNLADRARSAGWKVVSERATARGYVVHVAKKSLIAKGGYEKGVVMLIKQPSPAAAARLAKTLSQDRNVDAATGGTHKVLAFKTLAGEKSPGSSRARILFAR